MRIRLLLPGVSPSSIRGVIRGVVFCVRICQVLILFGSFEVPINIKSYVAIRKGHFFPFNRRYLANKSSPEVAFPLGTKHGFVFGEFSYPGDRKKKTQCNRYESSHYKKKTNSETRHIFR
jgi:hypothetical protein